MESGQNQPSQVCDIYVTFLQTKQVYLERNQNESFYTGKVIKCVGEKNERIRCHVTRVYTHTYYIYIYTGGMRLTREMKQIRKTNQLWVLFNGTSTQLRVSVYVLYVSNVCHGYSLGLANQSLNEIKHSCGRESANSILALYTRARNKTERKEDRRRKTEM